MGILTFLRQPWPWYVAGPLIGLTVPVLLLLGNKSFGISANLRHMCALSLGGSRLPSPAFFRYDWRRVGAWNLMFVAGLITAGILGQTFLASPEPLQLAQTTQTELQALGLETDDGIAPARLFGVAVLQTWQGWLLLLTGGLLIGFGARYAGGCTSGHAISGLAALQLPSLVAVIGFFVGGVIMTHVMLPYVVRALVHG